jgi:hypothetical protein
MNFIHSFDKIISLGCKCYVKLFLESIKYKSETQFFDYMGSSMWAINDLFKNDFSELLEDGIDSLEKKKILNSGFDKYVLTDKKYYLRFKHDFKQNCNSQIKDNIKIEDFNKVNEKYLRRKERLINILEDDKETLLFIRYEENQENRVKYFGDKKPEIDYIYEFIDIIKEKYPLKKFCILFLSDTMENDDKRDENLIILKNISRINIWTQSPKKIKNTIEHNENFL